MRQYRATILARMEFRSNDERPGNWLRIHGPVSLSSSLVESNKTQFTSIDHSCLIDSSNWLVIQINIDVDEYQHWIFHENSSKTVQIRNHWDYISQEVSNLRRNNGSLDIKWLPVFRSDLSFSLKEKFQQFRKSIESNIGLSSWDDWNKARIRKVIVFWILLRISSHLSINHLFFLYYHALRIWHDRIRVICLTLWIRFIKCIWHGFWFMFDLFNNSQSWDESLFTCETTSKNHQC
jgi:hypothetical protein